MTTYRIFQVWQFEGQWLGTEVEKANARDTIRLCNATYRVRAGNSDFIITSFERALSPEAAQTFANMVESERYRTIKIDFSEWNEVAKHRSRKGRKNDHRSHR